MKRSLPDEQIDRLAAEWADALRRGDASSDDKIHESVVVLSFAYTADVQWQFILAAVRHVDLDQLGSIAAGPFESLMGKNGDDYIDRVEDEAVRNLKFREMVRGSWRHMMNDDVWSRVEAIQALAAD